MRESRVLGIMKRPLVRQYKRWTQVVEVESKMPSGRRIHAGDEKRGTAEVAGRREGCAQMQTCRHAHVAKSEENARASERVDIDGCDVEKA